MTNEEILEKQVEALEKLLQLKQAIVEELESKIQKMEIEKLNYPYPPVQPQVYPQPISIPSVWTVDPCPTDGLYHEYPSPWYSTSPAPCKKCGKQTAPNFTVTSHNDIALADDGKPTTFTAVAKL